MRRFDRWVRARARRAGDARELARSAGVLPLGRTAVPTEAEWEFAALNGLENTGQVWEWTASDFLPYPGFVRDPYKEYSEPWFGTHKVLRGGSFASRTHRPGALPQFLHPERADMFVGFRTCAP